VQQALRTAAGFRVTWQPGDADEPLLRTKVQIRWAAKSAQAQLDVEVRACVHIEGHTVAP
jgi:hypothetical protein